MAILVDTNVLLRLLTQADAMHRPALDSIETLDPDFERFSEIGIEVVDPRNL